MCEKAIEIVDSKPTLTQESSELLQKTEPFWSLSSLGHYPFHSAKMIHEYVLKICITNYAGKENEGVSKGKQVRET